jgi:phosphonate transport system ATP-binding protein
VRIILADEPVASLDPESAATVLDTLRAGAREGVAMPASLHQVHRATSHADRIVALREGRIVQDAPASSLDARAPGQIHDRNGAAPRPARRGTLRDGGDMDDTRDAGTRTGTPATWAAAS